MQQFMSHLRKIAAKLPTQTWFSVLLVVFLVCTTTIQLTAIRRTGTSVPAGYSSDDVAQQTILSQWQRGYHIGAGLGDDNWFLKFPLYWTMNQAPIDPDARAFVTSWILTIITVVGSALIIDRIVKWSFGSRPVTLAARLLPTIALAALAPLALYSVAIMNTRNIEIPIFLGLLYILIVNADKPTIFQKQNYGWIVGVIAAISLLLADDPIFFYMGVVPIALVLGARVLRDKAPIRTIAEFMLILTAGYIGRWIVMKILLRFTTIIALVHPAQFASISGFYANVQALASSSLEIFGANIWGQIRSITAAVTAMNIFLLAMGLTAAGLLLWQARTNKNTGIGVQVIGVLPFWMIGLVAIANYSAEPRYLMVIPFILPICIGLAAGHKLFGGRIVAVIVGVMLLCASYNTANAASLLKKHPENLANIEERAIAKILDERHLVKGLGTYWVANAVTYTSDFKTDVIGVKCDDGVTYDYILSERAVFNKPSSASYVLSYEPNSGVDSVCPLDVVKQQFGEPSEIISIPTGSNGVIAAYDRDITAEVKGRP